MTEVIAEGILRFWFGEIDAEGLASKAKQKLWFAKDEAFDKSIKNLFGNLMELAPMGAYDRWSLTPYGRVALIILLDQFPRNLFRGKARAFYTDEKAQVQTQLAIKAGEHLSLPISYSYFVLMPLMHAENLELQDLGVKLFAEQRDRATGEGKTLMENALKFMIQHRDIIATYGRFPHGNEMLGRLSTPEEKAFLANGGPTF